MARKKHHKPFILVGGLPYEIIFGVYKPCMITIKIDVGDDLANGAISVSAHV